MRLRVLVLCRADPFLWTRHYVAAFRAHCDVITAGPTPDAAWIAQYHPRHAHLVQPNDIETDCAHVPEILAMLPTGWTPHLVVAVQSGGPLYQGVAGLGVPAAYISVDTWHDVNEYVAARPFDFVFAAQREYVPRLRATGCRNVHWLPLACAPEAHHPMDAAPDLDIAFVGMHTFAVNTERRARLDRLAARFALEAWQGLSTEEMCAACARGKLLFNSSVAQDVNMRVFEAMAMGRALLTNRDAELNGLLDLFEDGRHLIAYTDADLEAKAAQYLADDAARQRIAEAGRAEVLARHTYAHRVETLLETVRTGVPCLGQPGGGDRFNGGRLRNHVPFAPGCVLDAGLGLDVSKHALKRMGATRYVGCSGDGALRDRLARRYDAMMDWPPGGETFDTVCWRGPSRTAGTLDAAVRIAHDALEDGGTLVCEALPGELAGAGVQVDAEGLTAWLRGQGFLLLYAAPAASGGSILAARKRRVSVVDTALEVYARHPIAGTPLEEIRARAAQWPDSMR